MLSEEDYFSFLLLLVLIANHIATLFDLRTLFLRLLQDADSLCGWGANYAYNPGCVGRVGWARQTTGWHCRHTDVRLLTELIQSPTVLQ